MNLTKEEQVFLRLLMRDAWFDCDMRNKSQSERKILILTSTWAKFASQTAKPHLGTLGANGRTMFKNTFSGDITLPIF